MSEFTAQDCAHMARALRLAERGRFTAHPNPVVGCVLVKADEVVGEGWHEKTGSPHAEVNALRAAGNHARGATAYVTLEPCSHHGKTPPCATALIEAGVSDVVVAIADPYQSVSGQGLKALIEAGIGVRTGLMAAAATALNRGFLKRVSDNRPLVCLKLAMSIDGAIAMGDGESQWITGPAARADVQRLRARSGAVMTGIGTVLADDPSLNVRDPNIETAGLTPLRVILDTHLRTPPTAAMLALDGTTLVCYSGDRDETTLRESGAELMSFEAVNGRVSVAAVLQELARRQVNEVLVEAGAALAGHMLDQGLVDKLVIYQAPHIMGSQTLGAVHTPTWTTLADRLALDITDVRRIGSDTRITATPAN